MNAATVSAYALLRDGGQVLIRPYAPADRTALDARMRLARGRPAW
jgi:hypothetical protein